MLLTFAVSNYRTLLDVIMPLGQLTVVTGANGSGKSNLYRAMRLLADTASGGAVNSLAREGGLQSALWAGPETLSRRMQDGTVPVQGGPRRRPVRLRLGFGGSEFGYAVSFGLPPPPDRDNPNPTKFALDPEIKSECIWSGEVHRGSSSLVERSGSVLKVRLGRKWHVRAQNLNPFESIFSRVADSEGAPEALYLRDLVGGWRFYDQFRTDRAALTRFPQVGTRTPVLHHDGRDLAAALQTIREIGDHEILNAAISDAFPGSELAIDVGDDNRFSVSLKQQGLLRPLAASELSDGTLRYLLWVAALLSPRPPAMMVLNEPETSLHPELLPALGRLIGKAAERTQVWVVSHAPRLIASLGKHSMCNTVELDKELGATMIAGQGILDAPAWSWPDWA